MIVKLLTEHHLRFVSPKGGCTGSSESTLVKIPHCWKSHVTAQLSVFSNYNLFISADFQLSQRELEDREYVRWDLERFIQELYSGLYSLFFIFMPPVWKNYGILFWPLRVCLFELAVIAFVLGCVAG